MLNENQGLGHTEPGKKDAVPGAAGEVLTVRLTLLELMALKNAAADHGFIGSRTMLQSTSERLRGIGLIEHRNDVVDDEKLAKAVKENRKALAIAKPNPGDEKAIERFRQVLYDCSNRLRGASRSGLWLTKRGQRYAAMAVTIALPGRSKPTGPSSPGTTAPSVQPTKKDSDAS